MTELEVSPWNRRDLAVAAILVLSTSLFYACTAQGRIFAGDGTVLTNLFFMAERGQNSYHNALYFPSAHAFAAIWPLGGPLAPLYALSALCSALAVGVVYLCARSFVVRRDACAFAAAMFAVTPAVWFFATTIEVHSLHLCVVSICALIILNAPWHRPALALALTAAVLPVTYLSHQSAPILGPGWVMLAQFARSRRDRPFSLPALAGVGCLYLGALIAGHMITNAMLNKGMSFDAGYVIHFVGNWWQDFSIDVVWDMLLVPYALLVVAVPLAIRWARVSRFEGLAVAAFLVPSIGFFLWWGIAERGGYLLGPAIFAAILAAKLAQRGLALRYGRFWIALALALQLAAGAVFVRGFNAEGFQLDDRVARIERFLEDGGVVISVNDNAPNVAIWLPEVREFNLRISVRDARSSEEWLAVALPMLQLVIGTEPALLDTSYQRRTDLKAVHRECIAGLEAELERIYDCTRLEDASWPMLLLQAK